MIADAGFARALHERLETAIADGGRAVALHHMRRRPWLVRVAHWLSFGLLRLGVALTGVAGRY